MEFISYINDFEKWKEGFSFHITINVRFSETDMFGHVNNVSTFIYFEEARIEFLKSKALLTDSMNDHGVPVVSDLQCDYHKQMYFDDKIDVYVKANQIGTTSVDLHYMALNESGDICLTGRGRLVYVNPETGKPVSLSDSMRKSLSV